MKKNFTLSILMLSLFLINTSLSRAEEAKQDSAEVKEVTEPLEQIPNETIQQTHEAPSTWAPIENQETMGPGRKPARDNVSRPGRSVGPQRETGPGRAGNNRAARPGRAPN